jgi:hypothetical protein
MMEYKVFMSNSRNGLYATFWGTWETERDIYVGRTTVIYRVERAGRKADARSWMPSQAKVQFIQSNDTRRIPPGHTITYTNKSISPMQAPTVGSQKWLSNAEYEPHDS